MQWPYTNHSHAWLCSPSTINWYWPAAVTLWSWEGNRGPGRKWRNLLLSLWPPSPTGCLPSKPEISSRPLNGYGSTLPLIRIYFNYKHHTTTQPFYGPFSGITRVSRCQKRTSGFMVQGKTNRGIHINHPAGCHSIWTKQCPPPPSPLQL